MFKQESIALFLLIQNSSSYKLRLDCNIKYAATSMRWILRRKMTDKCPRLVHKWEEKFTYLVSSISPSFELKRSASEIRAERAIKRDEYSARNFRFRRLIGTRNPEMSNDAPARERKRGTIVISMKATRIITSRHRETIEERAYARARARVCVCVWGGRGTATYKAILLFPRRLATLNELCHARVHLRRQN